jgi:hypothetical protein
MKELLIKLKFSEWQFNFEFQIFYFCDLNIELGLLYNGSLLEVNWDLLESFDFPKKNWNVCFRAGKN